jgi:ZIP family zinc transporter
MDAWPACSFAAVLEAFLWGVISCSSLIVGAVIGLKVKTRPQVTGLLLGFGAGALISAVSFELAAEALHVGGTDSLAAGLAAGAATYFVGSRLLGRRHGTHPAASGTGALLALGALLDGVPESAALGLTLTQGGGVSVALLAAIFISNLPESAGSATIMRKGGSGDREVLGLWLGVAAAGVVACVLGFVLLDGASDNIVAAVQAFAAGAILTMLVDTMIPEATKTGGDKTGLATVLGFAVALLLSAAQ